jgi:hypothetical protein
LQTQFIYGFSNLIFLIREDVCKALEEAERELILNLYKIPAAEMALMHVRRAMELIGCPLIKEPVFKEIKKKAYEKGIIIE